VSALFFLKNLFDHPYIEGLELNACMGKVDIFPYIIAVFKGLYIGK